MLDGIVDDWCANQSLRAHVRKHKCLFVPAPGDEKPKCCLKCLEHNEGILTPLVQRMKGEDGDILVHTVPVLKKEKLASALRKLIFVSKILQLQQFPIASVFPFILNSDFVWPKQLNIQGSKSSFPSSLVPTKPNKI